MSAGCRGRDRVPAAPRLPAPHVLSLLPIRAPVEEERCQVELLTFQQRLPCSRLWFGYGITSSIRTLRVI